IAKFAHADDAAAAAALDTLNEAVAAADITDPSRLLPKGIMVLDMRRQLGVEGVTQYANAWLSTGRAEDRAKADAAIERVRVSLEKYKLHGLLPNEADPVERLNRELVALEQALDSRRMGYLDTTPVQRALVDLEAVIYAEATNAQNNLQKTLGDVSTQAGTIIVLVAVGAVFLLAGSVWLLVFRIGRRIKAITGTMRALASGKLDVEIPSSKDRDEIGEMSRA